MRQIFPWIVYGASVFLSRQYADGYWAVGPIFGAACLLVHFEKLKKGVAPRHGLFVIASTFTYALVYWIADHGWSFKEDTLDMLFGALSSGVVVGSLLMPFLHGLLFSTDIKTVRKASVSLVLSWYGANLLALADDALHVPWEVDYLLVAIALWQGLYLRSLKIA